MRDSSASLESKLAAILEKADRSAWVHELVFSFSSPSRGWRWTWPAERECRPYFIASATKLYVVAIIMQLRREGALDLDTPAATYLPHGFLDGLHMYRGVDCGGRITIRHLLAHTSGLADYFEQAPRRGPSTLRRILKQDTAWTLDDLLRVVRRDLRPCFPPGAPGRAFYSDTNYQLLGAIIEFITGAPYEEAVRRRIIEPLGPAGTFPFAVQDIARYSSIAGILYGKRRMHIPFAMASFRADGGMVSTARDGIAFLQAFMSGELFPVDSLAEMQREWRRIFFPMRYGLGLMRVELPRFMNLFRRTPALIGHSGATGAVLFHAPELDLYIAGTVNQARRRDLPIRLLIRLVTTCANDL